jgi:hypothetical protein
VTPAEALAPQPAPVPGEESVTDWLLTSLDYWGESDGRLASLLRVRRGQGRERYGTELEVDNGRDARVDQLQEAVDLYLYAAQEHIERGEVCTATRRMRLARELVEELCAELGVQP